MAAARKLAHSRPSTITPVLNAPYVVAKHALIGLAKVVAKEGAEHVVRANVIWPGFLRVVSHGWFMQ